MKRPARKTFRQVLEANQQTMDMYAALAGKPRVENEMLAALKPRLSRTKETKQNSKKNVPLEKEIQKAIIQYLLLRQDVAFVVRINSGTAVEYSAAGQERYIQYHKLYRRGERLVDIIGMLKCGRFFAIECKRPGWKKPSDDREREQAAFLENVNVNNGIGFFATTLDDVTEKLK